MIEFSIGLIVSSFLAGVFTFFAPCTLPLVPAFLGVIAGVGQEELQNPERVRQLRWKIFTNAIFYVIGFSIVFILFGVAFSLIGKILILRIWLQRIGGIFVVLFGLFLLGLIKIPWLTAERQIHSVKLYKSASKFNSFGIGALFALGWSPCVGPLLGSILFLASGRGTVLEGTFLLVMFSLGLAIPFLVTALLVGRAFTAFSRWSAALKVINIIAGLFLIVLGILLVSDQFSSVFAQFQGLFFKFPAFESFVEKFL